MVNQISDEKFERALALFETGHSIRQTGKIAGIAKETAHRIKTAYEESLFLFLDGPTTAEHDREVASPVSDIEPSHRKGNRGKRHSGSQTSSSGNKTIL